MMSPHVAAPDRYDSMAYRRVGSSGLLLPAISLGLWQNFGDDRPLDDPAGHRAARVRSRCHPLRPGQQLRPAVRLRRGELRAHPRVGPAAPIATSWSSRPRPATTCGRDRTAMADRASTSWPASIRASSGWASTTSTSSIPTDSIRRRLSRRRWARSTPPSGRARRSMSGISSYSAKRTREAAAILRDLGTPLLIHQPSYSMLNRWIEAELLDVLAEERIGASPSRRSPRVCSPTATSPASRPARVRRATARSARTCSPTRTSPTSAA